MDKIWDRKSSKSEVIGHCGGMKKPNDHADPTSRTLKNKIKNTNWLVFTNTQLNPVLVKCRVSNSYYWKVYQIEFISFGANRLKTYVNVLVLYLLLKITHLENK